MVTRLSSKGLEYASKMAIKEADVMLRNYTFPDLSGKIDILHIVDADWTVSGMQVIDWKLSDSISIQEDKIVWKLTNIRAQITGNWKYKSWIKSDSGTFNTRISDASIALSISFDVDKNGKLKFAKVICSSVVNGVGVRLSDPGNWLNRKISEMAVNKIKEMSKTEICQMVTRTIQENATTVLANLPSTVTLNKILRIDYGLLSKPSTNSKMIALLHRADVQSIENDKSNLIAAMPWVFPTSSISSKMVTVCLSEHLFNSLGDALYENKYLEHSLTMKDFPASAQKPVKNLLNSDLSGTTLEILVNPVRAPTFFISSDHVSLKHSVGITAMTSHSGGTKKILSKFQMEARIKFKPIVEGNRLQAHFTNMTTNMDDIFSQNEDKLSRAESLKQLFGLITEVYIIPKLIKLGKVGVPFPCVERADLLNPELSMKAGSPGQSGVIVISTDIRYRS